MCWTALVKIHDDKLHVVSPLASLVPRPFGRTKVTLWPWYEATPLADFPKSVNISGKVWHTVNATQWAGIYTEISLGYNTYYTCMSSLVSIYWCIVLHMYSLCASKLVLRVLFIISLFLPPRD